VSRERIALITGASTGIGEACAKLLAEEGWLVYAGVRKAADGDRVEGLVPGRIRALQIDVTDAAQISAAAARVRDEQGRLDGLVNNAGIAVAAPLEYVPIEMLRRQLEVNVTGQMAVTQAFLPLLREARGRISFISSTNGFLSVPFTGPYCASKFAIEAIADALRVELRPWGIEVSSIQPGAIATPIWEKSRGEADALADSLPEEAHRLYSEAIAAMHREVDRTVAERVIPPEEVAKCVLHAFTARRPKTRYRVGKDALPQYLIARWLPDRLRDWVLSKSIGLPARG
jgi:NAD(P)-dependent dehydrogenase (short-subunit alcohol dehydrogenase family)